MQGAAGTHRVGFNDDLQGRTRVGDESFKAKSLFISVVLPCLNEEDAVGCTVDDALRGLRAAGYGGEVIVVDNGSSDASAARAVNAGARVVDEPKRGYGAAHIAGIRAAKGEIVVMADADGTYDLENLGALILPLLDGADLVVASRLGGQVVPGAMPTLHRYIGTPIITAMLNVLTGVRLSDSQSGYRAFWRDRILALDQKAAGMEYASEMLLLAGRTHLDIREVPTKYRPRIGLSKLSAFSDGWRHIQMLMLLSPHLTLLFPGLAVAIFGGLLCLLAIVSPAGVSVGGLRWAPVFLGPTLLILGAQAAFLGAIAAHGSPLTPQRIRDRLAFLGNPRAVNQILTVYLVVALIGILIDVALFVAWVLDRSPDRLLGAAALGQALIVIGGCGLATIFAADYSRRALGW